MEFNYFLVQIIGLVISFFVLWGTSKLLKFKRNKIEYAFLFVAIMFVFSSIFQILFFIVGVSFLTLTLIIFTLGIGGIFLWFYLLMKIYKISFGQSLKVAGILFLVGLITTPLISIALPYQSPFDFPSHKDLSCEEKYRTFPLNQLSEEKKSEDLQICLENEILERGNPAECETTKSPDSCYSKFARAKSDESLCTKLDEGKRYFCYYSIARDKQDDSICENLPTESRFGDVSTCKFHVNLDIEVLKNNFNYCESIAIDWRKDYCYITFAKARLDVSICNKIEYEEFNSIQDCISSVNKWKDLEKKVPSLPEYYWV